MIQKLGKAKWMYRCTRCDYDSAMSVDLFGAQELQQRHDRSLEHCLSGFRDAFQLVIDAYASAARNIIGAAEQYQKDFALAPPPNIHHGPSLRRDRRKWGGR